MLRDDAADPSVGRKHVGSSKFQPSVEIRKSQNSSAFRQDTRTLRAGSPHGQSGFLSESDAATYLGMSIAQLVGLRNFDLVMIEGGFKPHGPPPLWRGGKWSYASETLDEWILNQSETYVKQRLKGRRIPTSK